ncbi:dihydrofolate reductase family protein [Ruicaihuangia caeni]|uniref:Dihydrofolate reductase family protein n=1 Tax=Ruicaihuangia caeni TaxID=3042517 RepID=A0AAW6T6R8_9MICO|nr:dihydrofolate reductase family protein [Klugiella sp. YN-L-19]MDI2097795.1 dihydrofolate reductase family protein [Klugiella sp. YN-L-19]
MGIIVANMFLTLDGVYQAPGGVDEDREDGFEYGGWQAPFADEASGESIGEQIQRLDALLLGRKTYDIFASYWPKMSDDHPVAAKFNAVPKYVVSTTLGEPEWAGTTVLPHAMAAAHLREQYDQVHLFGSGDLLRSLFTEDVVDRLNLWLYPITLGQGKRFFGAGTIPASFSLVEPARSFDKGAVSLKYQRSGEVETGDMDDVDARSSVE